MEVPFMDLKRQYELIKDEIDHALAETIERCAFVAGEKVREFEEHFAQYCGVAHAVGISSGTSALYVALRAMDIGKGDGVITVPYTFIATAEAISMTGARPVFVDISEDSFNMSPIKLEEYIKAHCEWNDQKLALFDKKSKTKIKAIVPVHLYGQVADMDEINAVAEAYGLQVLEDCAQAHGAEYKGKRSGSLGNAGAFSFYPSKNLGAYGQGGMVVTSDEALAQKARMIIDHGQKERYQHVFEGWNFKMDGMQAAVLDVKLGYLDEWNEDRRQNAQFYTDLLKDLGNVRTPQELPEHKHIYHLYAIRVPDRTSLMAYLKESGVGSAIHYPVPLHLQTAYKHLGYPAGSFPVAEKCAREIVSLPMFPELTKRELEYVCEKVIEWSSAVA